MLCCNKQLDRFGNGCGDGLVNGRQLRLAVDHAAYRLQGNPRIVRDMFDGDGLAASRHVLLIPFAALHTRKPSFAVRRTLIDANPVYDKLCWNGIHGNPFVIIVVRQFFLQSRGWP